MRRITVAACLISLLALAADTTFAARRKARPVQPGNQIAFSDDNVDAAVKRGVEFLWSSQAPDGSWAGPGGYPVGPTAMAAYAILESGDNTILKDPRMIKALEWLKKTPTKKTYDLGLRAQTWLAAIKKGGPYRTELRKDVEVLVKSTADGSYNYDSNADGKSAGDHSNSQYGLLGVWAGALGNLEIPRAYWQLVLVHWINAQNQDGGWVYGGGGGSQNSAATMTAAGVSSLFVCFDQLLGSAFVRCDLGEKGRLAQTRIQRGLDWFDKNFDTSIQQAGGHALYYLYGVERVGLASGYKYFGTSDWYKIGATYLLSTQAANGSWEYSGTAPGTSFALLFLIRGRNPLLFSKLEFNGDWNNRPRDLAYLTRWLTDVNEFERDVHWQIINTKVPPEEWHDAPILYISGARAIQLSDEEVARIRRYVGQGGAIFSTTACGGMGFETAIRKAYERIFPDYKLTVCGKEHKVYTVHRKLNTLKGQFHLITNGVRPLVIHTDQDLARSWQLESTTTGKEAFEAAANIYAYMTDRSFRARGEWSWPEEPKSEPNRVIKLARIKFDGNWDPEPLAYERFSRLMASECDVKIEVIPAVTADKLAATGAKVATLTGTGELKLNENQQEKLREFVEDGGTLVVDAAGGDRDFEASASRVLEKMYQGARPRQIYNDDPILMQEGMEIKKVAYRRLTRMRISNNRVALRVLMVGDRPGVIYSREDITAGLVGYTSYTVDGYDPESAFEIMRNIVFYASPDKATSRPSPAPAAAAQPAQAK